MMWPFKPKEKEPEKDWQAMTELKQAEYQEELDSLAKEFPIGSVWIWLDKEIVVGRIGAVESLRYFYGVPIAPTYKIPGVWFYWRENGEEKSDCFYPSKLDILHAYNKARDNLSHGVEAK